MHGFLVAKGVDIDCLGSYTDIMPFKQYNNLLNKFPYDQIFLNTDQEVCFFDGFVYNKAEIMKKRDMDWKNSFSDYIKANPSECLSMLRGNFCGYFYDKEEEAMTIFTDHLGAKALYYYINGDQWIISNNVVFILNVLKENHCPYNFNDVAAQYMLSYGYMLDDSTFVRQIHRVLPGYFISIKGNKLQRKRYYQICNTEERMTETEAIEKIDFAFRRAVYREFEKDIEYGYRHLVDLSGGLDSRMVSWVAHDLGYTDQVNITYCRAGYNDDIISKEIACYLHHEYIFKTLDDAKWLYDVDSLTEMNNGAAYFCGITGGGRLLSMLKGENFGIEHTGMIGDAILSTFYRDKNFNYQKPKFGMHRYSEMLSYNFDSCLLEEYPNQEIFAIYTRGILGAQASYMIRQNYVEPASPFTDVDFLDTVFSVPFEYRRNHHIYLKWMMEKYPESANFGWEKWGGIKPKVSHIWLRKINTSYRLFSRFLDKITGKENRDSMNPVDYWYGEDENIQKFFREYYEQNIKLDINEHIKNDISKMFFKGNVIEKSMALTVLAMAKRIYY